MQRNYQYETSIYDATLKSILHYFTCAYEAFGVFFDAYTSGSKDVMRAVYVGGNSPTNVFTWYRTFISYLSYLGVIIFPFLFGALSGIFYNLPQSSLAVECANAWIGCMLFMSFYSFLWTHRSYWFTIIVAYIIDTFFFKNMYLNQLNSINQKELHYG